jgi:hypothetical protein
MARSYGRILRGWPNEGSRPGVTVVQRQAEQQDQSKIAPYPFREGGYLPGWTGRTPHELVEIAFGHWPNGHQLGPNQVPVGHGAHPDSVLGSGSDLDVSGVRRGDSG